MQQANDAYLVIALLNVIGLIIKHFVYFYVIVGEKYLSILRLISELDASNALYIAS